MSFKKDRRAALYFTMSDIVHSVQTSFENRFLLLKMDLDIENYTITKFDNLKSKNELLGLCCNSGSLIARDGFPQEIWLKIFSYLRVLDLRKCVQVCKWMHCICLDRSLKYHAVREIYQTTSNRFIKTLFYFKENELMREMEFERKNNSPVPIKK